MSRWTGMSRSRVITAAGALVALGATLVPGQLAPDDVADPQALDVAAVVATPEAAPPATPAIEWSPCRDGYECASVAVPLDYDHPTAASIELALVRLPAADPERRIGSLFVNPGGPGGSGVDFVRGVGQFTPLEIRASYDLVGFDPRGIARSTPVRCFESEEDAFSTQALFAFPLTQEEEGLWEQADRARSDACVSRAGAIINHMSTANVARDLDLLRRAVGDDKLNFLGFSYGSYLGVTYANMFPGTVGALVVDGVLDPVAWSTGRDQEAQTEPFSTRLRSDSGASLTLGEFFRLCDDAGDDCALSGGAEQRYAALADKLLEGPLVVEDEFGEFAISYQDLVAVTLGALYAPFIWPDLAELLAFLEAGVPAAAVRETVARLQAGLGLDTALEIETDYYNGAEGYPGVACSDSDNPPDYDAWAPASDAAEARYRYFGELRTWGSSVCQPWPGADDDRYMGPWTAETSSPVLVVGNEFDPATPYSGAVAASGLLPSSRLLTYAGWGHSAYLVSGNFCVDDAVTRYLVTGQLPPEGAVCEPQGSPFGPVEPQARVQAEDTAPIRTALLPDPVRRALVDLG